jgi:hypothetical protein
VQHWHQRLCESGWSPSTERFWNSAPCFYDLGTVKTVILFKSVHVAAAESHYADVYYWKYGGHNLPDYLEPALVEVRRYKLHHSMYALLWHDHGDRPL